jgi:hypothetical protein
MSSFIRFRLIATVAVCLSSLVTCSTFAQDLTPVDKAVRAIKEKGFKRVAVIPRVVVRATGDTNRVAGKNTLGALSYEWPDELYDSLIDAASSSNGQFSVVPEHQILQALKGKTSEDVGSEEMWKVIREKTGADFLASVDVTDPGPVEGKTGSPEIQRAVSAVDLRDNSAALRVRQEYRKSLSDAAFSGESFVVREWKNGSLDANGLSGGLLFDTGAAAEKEQYAKLMPQDHPLLRDDYPLGIGIEVGGELRTPKVVDGQLVVQLDVGEEYVIRAWNRGDEAKGDPKVFMGLYVDGVNTVGATRERPELTPTTRTWFLRPIPEFRRIAGWLKIDPQSRQTSYERFVVVGAAEAVAREAGQPGGDGFDDNLGLITAVFYTYGMKGIPKTKGAVKPVADSIGTGRGRKEDGGVAGFESLGEEKGLMLSSVSIYYRSSQWFRDFASEPHSGSTNQVPEPEKISKENSLPPDSVKDIEDDLPK